MVGRVDSEVEGIDGATVKWSFERQASLFYNEWRASFLLSKWSELASHTGDK